MTPFDVTRGDSPIILGQPHGGTWLPDDLLTRLNDNGRALADTDWHITQLYDGLLPDVTVVRSNIHRYAIDANRDPARQSLYPGQNTTDLCPTTDFDGRPIWQSGQEPSDDETDSRTAAWHVPYHAALRDEMERIKAKHSIAILYDCHSIRSKIPFLFDGILPVFSIGTNAGTTCAPNIEQDAQKHCAEAAGYDHVLNGRFKGGWTTRHYGHPQLGEHAIQMELAQREYLADETAPWAFDPTKAAALRQVLGPLLQSLDNMARSGALTASNPTRPT